jgi:ankyrin repeat protein
MCLSTDSQTAAARWLSEDGGDAGVKLLRRRISFRTGPVISAVLIGALAQFSGTVLAQTLSVPKPDAMQGSPLAEAARQRDRQAVQAFLDRGLDVNGRDTDGTPALHWAVRVDDRDLVDMLLAAGADVNSANRYGQAPIHVAVEYRHVGLLGRLFDAGADIETANASGEPPLLIAARLGAVEVVEALLALGADVNARDRVYGQSACAKKIRIW